MLEYFNEKKNPQSLELINQQQTYLIRVGQKKRNKIDLKRETRRRLSIKLKNENENTSAFFLTVTYNTMRSNSRL